MNLKKLIARSPDMAKVEALAIKNCVVLYNDEDVISFDSFAEVRG